MIQFTGSTIATARREHGRTPSEGRGSALPAGATYAVALWACCFDFDCDCASGDAEWHPCFTGVNLMALRRIIRELERRRWQSSSYMVVRESTDGMARWPVPKYPRMSSKATGPLPGGVTDVRWIKAIVDR